MRVAEYKDGIVTYRDATPEEEAAALRDAEEYNGDISDTEALSIIEGATV